MLKTTTEIADLALELIETKKIQPHHAAAIACHKAEKHDNETFNEVHSQVIRKTVHLRMKKYSEDRGPHLQALVVSQPRQRPTVETTWHRQRKYA